MKSFLKTSLNSNKVAKFSLFMKPDDVMQMFDQKNSLSDKDISSELEDYPPA